MQRMLTDPDLSLPDAQKEVQELFGDDHENDIQAMLNKINDLDPNELKAGRGEITVQVEEKLQSSIAQQVAFARDEDVEMGSPSAMLDEEEGQSEQDHTEGWTINLEKHLSCLKWQLDEQTLLAQWTAQIPNDTINYLDYQIFSIACQVSLIFVFSC